jgi:hypothetical protein
MGRADLANRSVDRRRPNLSRPTLMEALDLAHHLANDVGFHVLLTGRRARSPISQNAFQNQGVVRLIALQYPLVLAKKVHFLFQKSGMSDSSLDLSFDTTT